MHNTSNFAYPRTIPAADGDVFIADSIEKCRVGELVYNAHAALLHRTTFFYMKSISAATVFILSSSTVSDVSPIFFAHRFVHYPRGLLPVIVATTDARINIVFVVRNVPALTPIFHQQTRRKVKLEKVEMRKSRTAYSFPAGNIAISFHLVS